MWFGCLLFLLPILHAEPTEDLITDPLPGMNDPVDFRQFSGYLNISQYKQLFYWYVESQSDPENDPVILWLNGGPGCSSLQGLLYEIGPFRVSDWGNTVTSNPLSWNKYSNIIFLDASAGVGFSVRSDGSYKYTDDEVADDNHLALLQWYEKFPKGVCRLRKTNDLYIMGESYAGTFIPMLSNRLIDDKANFPMLKGLSVGNGCLDDKLLWNTQIQYNYYHSLIDEKYYVYSNNKCCENVTTNECDFYGMVFTDFDFPCHGNSITMHSANLRSGLDPYFLYSTCILNEEQQNVTMDTQRDVMLRHLRRKTTLELPERVPLERRGDPENADYDPALPACEHTNDYLVWLQLPEIRTVLHIPDSVPQFEICNKHVERHYTQQYDTMTSYVKKAVDAKLRVMFFNGDLDLEDIHFVCALT